MSMPAASRYSFFNSGSGILSTKLMSAVIVGSRETQRSTTDFASAFSINSHFSLNSLKLPSAKTTLIERTRRYNHLFFWRFRFSNPYPSSKVVIPKILLSGSSGMPPKYIRAVSKTGSRRYRAQSCLAWSFGSGISRKTWPPPTVATRA